MQAMLTKAIENYRRQRFLEHANAAFVALRDNPDAWNHEREEREAWDQIVSDGLDEE